MIERNLKPGWNVWRFDQMATNVNARIDNPSESGMEHYVGLEHLDADSLKIRRWGSPDDVEATKLMFKKGDIIFGRRRAYQRKLGVAEFDGICSAHAMVLRAKPDVVIPEFLPFFMQSDIFMNRAVEISVGSLSPTINWKTMAVQEFALPPIREQKGIVLSLSSVDDMIGSLQEAESAARNVFESTAKEFFESSSNKWPRKRIDEVSLFVTNGFVGKSAQHYVAEGGVPYLVSKNIRRNRLKLDEVTYISEEFHHSSKKSQLLEGDILTVQSGHIGETAVVPKGYAGANCHALIITRPDPKQLDPYFASYYLNSAVGQRRLSQLVIGSTIQHLNTSDLKKLDIPQPNIEEQKRISALLSSIASDQELLAKRIEDAKQLRLQLLAEVFA